MGERQGEMDQIEDEFTHCGEASNARATRNCRASVANRQRAPLQARELCGDKTDSRPRRFGTGPLYLCASAGDEGLKIARNRRQ